MLGLLYVLGELLCQPELMVAGAKGQTRFQGLVL